MNKEENKMRGITIALIMLLILSTPVLGVTNIINDTAAVFEVDVTAPTFFGNLNWSYITNPIITAVDNIWLYFDGTTVTFNETKLNESQDIRYYTKDLVYNTTSIDSNDAVQNVTVAAQKFVFIDNFDQTLNSSDSVSFSSVTASLTGNADSASALEADPADCSAGEAPVGINAAGVAQSCTAYLQSESFVGTVTSVAAGNGLDFSTFTTSGSVVMGTPSALTGSTSDAVTATSHTHSITSLTAAKLLAGTVGTGAWLMSNSLKLSQGSTSGNGLWVYRDLAAASTDGPVVFIESDNAGDDQAALSIQNDGSGYSILINHVGSGYSFFVDTATNDINIDNTGKMGIGDPTPDESLSMGTGDNIDLNGNELMAAGNITLSANADSFIWANSSCTVIEGDTSQLVVC